LACQNRSSRPRESPLCMTQHKSVHKQNPCYLMVFPAFGVPLGRSKSTGDPFQFFSRLATILRGLTSKRCPPNSSSPTSQLVELGGNPLGCGGVTAQLLAVATDCSAAVREEGSWRPKAESRWQTFGLLGSCFTTPGLAILSLPNTPVREV
jgi:hypothetical protein